MARMVAQGFTGNIAIVIDGLERAERSDRGDLFYELARTIAATLPPAGRLIARYRGYIPGWLPAAVVLDLGEGSQ